MSHSPLRILVVDDNRSAADALARVLRNQGDQVEATYDGGTAIDRIQESPPDVVLTDLKMEPVDGMAVLQAARAQRPPVEVIVFTAYGAVDIAVKAMHLGARDFLTKPVTVEQVTQRLEQLRTPEPQLSDDTEFRFVAESPAAKELVQRLRRAAAALSPVWIEGEIGSGREHAARALHRFTKNPEAPFRVMDLGRDLVWPTNGTALLPNVGNLPDDLQLRLYRSLSQAPETVRLIATSGPGGRQHVTDGSLRPELYYRLAVVTLDVPPLRERKEDVLPLVREALTRHARRYGRPVPSLRPDQERRLTEHAWPGNIRELGNLTERAVVMGVEALDIEPVPAPPAGMPALEPGFSLSNYLEGVERRILEEALRKSDGDRTAAGRLLGVERNTLRYKLNKYGLL